MTHPLSGIQVLDFGQYLAGPLVGMMLADFGAEVVRIDPPDGPRWPDPAFDMLSRGKKSIVLDLKSPADPSTAKTLASRADVVIENFRPGVMTRLGLDAAALREDNPNLVYLSLPGFASTDPGLARVPAWEAVIAARTGQFTDMGLNRVLMGINPSFTPLALASAYGAVFGAMSVLFALAARGRPDEKPGGDAIEVPLASALFEGLVYNSERIENYPDRYKSPRELEIDRRRAAGEPMDMPFNDLQDFLDPFYRTYRCADGRGFYVVAASHREHPKRVLQALGLDALLAELPDFDVYADQADWPGAWSLRSYPVGPADRARITRAMEAAFLSRPAAEWERIFGETPAPATKQQTTRDWLADPHARASGLIVEVDDPRHGMMRQMGNVAWLGGDEDALAKTPGPLPDQHRDAILTGLAAQSPPPPTGVRDGERRPPQADPCGACGWLTGLKVLDLTNVIAGPTIASTLARFGAEVTQIGTIEPSMDPWNGVVFGLHANRGKQSALLDIKSPEGREAFERLLAEADVVTCNSTDRQRDRLGLNPEVLARTHPRLIVVQLDMFGGPARGPKSDFLGYDDLAQAATGVMARFGGGLETPEEHAHLGTIDVLTGFCACVALGAALVRREATGKGGLARASLAAAGNLIQAPFMYDFAGRAPFDEPSGREVRGWGPFYHCYEASDGWFFLAAPVEQAEALGRVLELADLAHLPGAALTEALMDRFTTEPIAHWQAALAPELNRGTTTVMPLATLAGTRDEALVPESAGAPDISRATFRAIRHDRHPMGRWVDLVVPNAVRPANARITIPAPAPKHGADTRAVLARLGYDEVQIDRMIAEGIAATSWSEKYLPE